MDTLSPEKRSEIMSRVRAKDTKPEMIVRRMVHSMGYRYRLHSNRVPGNPDLVFGPRRKVIFVHGCFWHRHEGCPNCRTPKSRVDFWEAKFAANKRRDLEVQRELKYDGWDFIIIWECEVKDLERIKKKIVSFLESASEFN